MTAYRNRQYSALIATVAVLFTAASLVAALVREGSAGDRFTPLIPVVLLSAFCLLRLARAGVYADSEKVRILNPLKTVELPWERVVRFSLRPSKGFPAVGWAELVDGEPVQIWGIQARSSAPAATRIPRELVEALNERLAQEKRLPAPPPTP